MECREQCGACCIAPSISSVIPGMANGKPAGVTCIHLSKTLQCNLFGDQSRPKVCSDFKPTADVCGISRTDALELLTLLEEGTRD